MKTREHRAAADPYAIEAEFLGGGNVYDLCAYFCTFGDIASVVVHETHACIVFLSRRAVLRVLETPRHVIDAANHHETSVRPKLVPDALECPKPYSPARHHNMEHVAFVTMN